MLLVRTDRGDLVLDNQDGRVLLWNETPYTYLKRQSQADAAPVGRPDRRPRHLHRLEVSRPNARAYAISAKYPPTQMRPVMKAQPNATKAAISAMVIDSVPLRSCCQPICSMM